VHCPDALDMVRGSRSSLAPDGSSLLSLAYKRSPQVIPNDHPQVIVRSPPGDPVPILYLSC
jgi:hypothetical protein